VLHLVLVADITRQYDTIQQAFSFFFHNYSIEHFVKQYQTFTLTFKRYKIKLHEIWIKELFSTFDKQRLQIMLVHLSNDTVIRNIIENLKIIENDLYSHQQLKHLYARKLWDIQYISFDKISFKKLYFFENCMHFSIYLTLHHPSHRTRFIGIKWSEIRFILGTDIAY